MWSMVNFFLTLGEHAQWGLQSLDCLPGYQLNLNCYAYYCTHQQYVPAFLALRVLFFSSCILAVHAYKKDRCVCTYKDTVVLFSRWKHIINCYWSVSYCIVYHRYSCHLGCSYSGLVEEGNLCHWFVSSSDVPISYCSHTKVVTPSLVYFKVAFVVLLEVKMKHPWTLV